MTDIPKIFGSMVFNREVMRQRLSSDVYERLIDVIENGRRRCGGNEGVGH